ncbi:hypothetical protein [Nocardioides sp. L-11A]|uniref:hypothetical protein n=1 Tax=Nocardioides sp. L-11A TaxID=3043848 RepID=UPI002499FF0D|nr:hypothetical protein QJ852_06500 [Nocardioides sp. L-11A]
MRVHTSLTWLLAAALSSALVGCSSGDGEGSRVIGTDGGSGDSSSKEDASAAAEAEDFVVTSGFTTGEDSIGTRYTSAGARLTNPNRDLAAYDVQVLFNLVGSNGDVLDTTSETVYYVAPGETVPVAPLQIGFEAPEVPAELQVQVVGEFVKDEGPRGAFGGEGAILDFVGGKINKGEYGNELTAQVKNLTEVVVELPEWDCIYLRGDKIVGGSSSTITDPIPPGTTVQFGESLSPDSLMAPTVECRVVADL